MSHSHHHQWRLVAAKRAWVPNWLFRVVRPIVLIYPFQWIFTSRLLADKYNLEDERDHWKARAEAAEARIRDLEQQFSTAEQERDRERELRQSIERELQRVTT